ncbi:serine/threonine-protein kinase [Litoribacillus peritrichatus]|uniref:Serine/threonine-protein kinase n=1 Tax=Litoribacillus peritrichatus TaxID=718191 RepID=A0ABP7MAU8_9GAMM
MSKKESSPKTPETKKEQITEEKAEPTTTSAEPTTSADRTQIDLSRTKKKQSASMSLEGKCIKDRYQLENKIGSGGMSDIYRAKDLFLEQAGIKDAYVAIKVLQHQFVDQPEALQLLLKEADKTRSLSHPNIIRVYDVDSDGEIHFLVMEYLDGETLDQIIKRSKPKGLKLDGAIKLLEQMSAALSYAHKSGIVHTDLKPANIILTRDGHIKLLDFGVAQALQMNHDKYAAENKNLTAPNGGYTPAYASPELLAGNLPSIQDDVFSFACVAYELLTSKHPFERLPADKAKTEKKTALKPKHLNGSQWKALNKALSFSKESRTKDVSSVFASLTHNPWPKLALAAGISGIIGVSGWFAFQQQVQINQSVSEITALNNHDSRINALSNMPAEQFFMELPKLNDASAIEKQGLIRKHRTALLNAYEKKVDLALNDRENTYPNYPKAEELLNEIVDLYPDSHSLAKQAISVQRGKQTAMEALDERLHALLRKGNYKKSEDENDVYQLLHALKYIENTYNPRPTDQEISTYKANFTAAIKSHDAVQLEDLINVGNVFFKNIEETQEFISLGQQLKEAVTALAKYQEAISSGNETEYPYQAATVLYQDSFESFNQRVETSRTVENMDKVYKEVESLSKELPADFNPLLKVRKNMANKYLSLADELIKKRQVRTANKVMRRANQLILSTNI